MRSVIFVLVAATILSTPLLGQRTGDKDNHACPVSAEFQAKTNHYLDLAQAAVKAMDQGDAGAYPRDRALGAIATGEACLGRYEQAATLADSAYPGGGEALDSVGLLVARTGKLTQAAALAKLMTHGAESFYYGIVEELASEGKVDDAAAYLAQVTDSEMRMGATNLLITAEMKAGRKADANALEKKIYDTLSAEQKQQVSLNALEVERLIQARKWAEARAAAAKLPGNFAGFVAISIAVDEADDHLPAAHDDLAAAAVLYDEQRDTPPIGYLLASRLASVGDFAASEKVAAAIHDDEWNQKAWATLAAFQAEDGKLTETRASIAKIGSGLGMVRDVRLALLGRNAARQRVAEALIAKGHADTALTFLAEEEDAQTGVDLLLSTRVKALTSAGDVAKARALVEAKLKEHGALLTEDDQNLAVALVRPWYRKDATAAEQWVAAQASPQIRASGYLALATEASGEKPQVSNYFVNWN